MAGDSIGKLSATITADARGFDRVVQHARGEAEQLKHGIGEQFKQIGEIRLPGILPIAGGVALAELPMKILEKTVEFAKEGVRWFLELARGMHEIQVMADRLHVGTVELQLMQVAAAGAGVDLQAVATGLDRMQKAISQAAHGSEEQLKLFRELSLSPARLEAMAPDRAMREVAMALEAIENPMERTRLEMELFGRSGARLRLFLDEMAGGMDAFRGIVADETTVEQLAEIAHAIELLQLAIKGLGAQMVHFAIEDVKQFLGVLDKILPRADSGPRYPGSKVQPWGLDPGFRLPGADKKTAMGLWLGPLGYEMAELQKWGKEIEKNVRRGQELDEAFRPFREGEAAEQRAMDALNDYLDQQIDKREELLGSYDKLREKIEDQTAKLKEGYSEAAEAARKFLEDAKKSGQFKPYQLDEMKLGLDLLVRGLETEKEYAEARKAAKAATEHAATAEEKFRDAVQRAHEWRTMGIIGADKEAALVRAAQKDLLGAWKSQERWEPAPLARRGSAEEYAIVAKAVTAAQENQAVTSRLDTIAQNTADTARAVERNKQDAGAVVSIPP